MKLKPKPKNRSFQLDPLLLAFLIPFLGMLGVLLVGGYSPFSTEKALLYSDEYHQYYPFFVSFRKALLSGDSLLYSWSVGMGMDYLGLISYYLGSPLNLLSILVPEEFLLEYFSLLSPIKLGLAGLFFAIFLKHAFHKDDHSIALFGGAYALCAWTLGYQWNIMWLDSFALLPLVALGTLQLLKDKKTVLYTVSLFLSVLINYYIGFFVCIFVLLVFICYQICRATTFKRFAQDLGRIALFSILALGMTAILELPAFAALQNTQSSVNNFPETFQLNIVETEAYASAQEAWTAFKTASDSGASFISVAGLWFEALIASFPPILDGMRQIAGNMGGASSLTFMEGLPNIYCGVFSIVLGFLFLTAKDVRIRDKICSIGMLLFIMLSFLLRQLDYIWHGFHFTNQIPYRFSFLFSFVLLYMAYRAWLLRHSFKPWQMITASFLAIGIILCSNDILEPFFLVFNLGLITLYLSILILSYFLRVKPQQEPEPVPEDGLTVEIAPPKPRVNALAQWVMKLVYHKELKAGVTTEQLLPRYEVFHKQALSVIFLLVMGVELILDLVGFGIRFKYTTVKDYPKGTKYTDSLVDYIYEREDEGDFFRTETTHTQTLNDGALNGYNGISTFSSSANVRVTEFMNTLGYGAKNTYNRYAFEESSPVANLFLNLKYMLERDADVEDNSYFDLIHGYGPVFLLENNAYLPLGFLADPTLEDCSLEQMEEYAGSNNFLKQNYMFQQATGLDKPVWNMVRSSCLSITGSKSLELPKANNATGYTIYATGSNAATLRYTYTMDRSGFLCLDLNMTKRNSYAVYKNNEQLFSETVSLPQMIAVCEVEAGDKIYIDITCKSDTDRGVVLIRAAQLDDPVFRQGYDILNASTLDLTHFSNTRIEGTIDCNRDGLLYTSIPYDGNWVAQVDGKEVEPVLVGDCMMALPMTEGTHTVTFRYENHAFTTGLLISLVSLVIFLSTILVPYYIEKNKGKYLKEDSENNSK